MIADNDLEQLLRAALHDHLEDVMTTTDTERELERFRASTRRASAWRRTLPAAAAAAALLAAGTLGYAVLSSGDSDGDAVVAAPRALAADEVQTVRLPSGGVPGDVAVLGDEVVVTTGPALLVLDGSGEVVRRLPAVGGEYSGTVVPAGGGWWLPFFAADESEGYVRVDPASGERTAFAQVGPDYLITSGDAGLWAVGRGNDLVRLDPSSGAVLDTVTLPFRPFGIWASDDEVWAQAASGGRLVRVDASTGELTDGPTLGGSAPGVLAGDVLWVADPTTAEVVRIDADSGAVLGRTAVPGGASGSERTVGYRLSADEESVYVTTSSNGPRALVRLDRSDARVLDAVELPNGRRPFALDSSSDAVWLGSPTTSEVLRLDPPRR